MGSQKKLQEFTNDMANKYTALYDVYRDEEIDDIPLAFLAIYKRRDERYMITKKIKVYGVENQQIIFTTVHEQKLNTDFLHHFQKAIERNATQYIPENQEHMSTIVLGVVITAQKIDDAVIKEVSRFRKLKFLKFGLHGWVEMYLVIINLHDEKVYVHPKGKMFISSIDQMFKEDGVKQ